ncbi:hypothetical protein F5146DRAFT_1125770 [Armillaria mellea]|nr:hypothetical protein F5146DRAFT_1125770 [Armillaria mellea]
MSFSSGSTYATGNVATPPVGFRTAGLSSSGRSSGLGPERSPHRSRNRPQSLTNNYDSSRANSKHRPRPSTPPPRASIPADAHSPLSPPSRHNKHVTTIYKGATFAKFKVPRGQDLRSLPSANLSAVPRRGSTPAIEFQKRFEMAKNHASTSKECPMTICAYWRTSASVNDYELMHKMKPPQPGDVVHYRDALPHRFVGKVDFNDKHLAIHPMDPTRTDVLAGVSLVEVLLAESGHRDLALIDGETSVRFIDGNTPTTIDLTINEFNRAYPDNRSMATLNFLRGSPFLAHTGRLPAVAFSTRSLEHFTMSPRFVLSSVVA